MAIDGKKAGKALAELRKSLNLEPADVEKRSKKGISSRRVTSLEKDCAEGTLVEFTALGQAYDYTPAGLIRKITKGA